MIRAIALLLFAVPALANPGLAPLPQHHLLAALQPDGDRPHLVLGFLLKKSKLTQVMGAAR